eukprot:gnl/MRDRNA2_/MRDRNA2_49234_c0_seq1.p1 gnl/MRDRNA2_/MRDRNA2_49234_c0~~gnl/MRDRNA2_/MRDRNA2_49234_c0_seq1.p1  ORF type:complete len:312 (+),score=54.17 gnl/MRDRNA2_/MRDRNA2_49234_c0_seq1:88-1023(+)
MSVNSGDRSTQRSKDSRSTATREKDMLKGQSKPAEHRSPGKHQKMEMSGNSGNWERYAPSEVSVSMVSDASRRNGPAQVRAQSVCSGSKRSSGSGSGYGAREARVHRRQKPGTPIPESVCSSVVESVRQSNGSAGSARKSSKAGSKMGSQVSGASGQSFRPGDSQCDNSMVSGSQQQRPASAPSRSSASRAGSEAPSGSYYTYGSQASSMNPTSTELAMANRMKQQRRLKTGRVFDGKTSYRETFKTLPVEERIILPRGLMLHMHPEWIPSGSIAQNTTTSRAHFANHATPDQRAAGSSTALEVSPLICDW